MNEANSMQSYWMATQKLATKLFFRVHTFHRKSVSCGHPETNSLLLFPKFHFNVWNVKMRSSIAGRHVRTRKHLNNLGVIYSFWFLCYTAWLASQANQLPAEDIRNWIFITSPFHLHFVLNHHLWAVNECDWYIVDFKYQIFWIQFIKNVLLKQTKDVKTCFKIHILLWRRIFEMYYNLQNGEEWSC